MKDMLISGHTPRGAWQNPELLAAVESAVRGAGAGGITMDEVRARAFPRPGRGKTATLDCLIYLISAGKVEFRGADRVGWAERPVGRPGGPEGR